jgi:IS5 family transposase
MDGEMLRLIYHRLFKSDSSVAWNGCIYSDAIIVLIHVMAVLTNHSARWAHDQRNWPLWSRRLKFPSYSQLMRRLKKPIIMQLINQLNAEYRGTLSSGDEKVCDGKPLVISGFSKDPDAGKGKTYGGDWHVGYKVHALIDQSSGAIDAFDVTALNQGEPTVMHRIIDQPQVDLRNKIVRGDSNYDSNTLYKQMADHGGRLIAPRKKPGTGLGHHPQHTDRLRAIDELEASDDAANQHEANRIRIEQSFAHLTNVPFGFWALPNHVRRLHRVRAWIRTKIMLYHLYRNLSQPKALVA